MQDDATRGDDGNAATVRISMKEKTGFSPCRLNGFGATTTTAPARETMLAYAAVAGSNGGRASISPSS
jgi:hypothetical protein